MNEREQFSATESETAARAALPEPSEAEVASTIGELEQTIQRETQTPEPPPVSIKEAKTNSRATKPGVLFLLAGVILPFISLAVELTTRMSAGIYVDPLPTLLHVLLVAFVPFGNLLVWLAPRREWFHLRQPLINNQESVCRNQESVCLGQRFINAAARARDQFHARQPAGGDDHSRWLIPSFTTC